MHLYITCHSKCNKKWIVRLSNTSVELATQMVEHNRGKNSAMLL